MKKETNKTNREWHEHNRMPPNAGFEQRVAWHIAHAANCSCRSMPENIKRAIEERNNEAKQDGKA